MFCLVSIDGLSDLDLETLKDMLPKSGMSLNFNTPTQIDTGVLTSPQAIWAEIFTEQPWQLNGCGGYSRPKDSLNSLSVFSESDSLKPFSLLEAEPGKKTAVINFPLVKPRDDNRIWLSDGSLPTSKRVSPSKLALDGSFAKYVKPRPYRSFGAAVESSRKSAFEYLQTDHQRIDCATDLLHAPEINNLFVRLISFDQISHLFGTSFLQAKDLAISEDLVKLTAALDHFLLEVIKSGRELILVSAYSHSTCEATVNLNSVLIKGGYLALSEDAIAPGRSQRFAAASAILGTQPISYVLQSSESRISTSTTRAASPVAGSIFINDKIRFSDGTVEPMEVSVIRSEITNYLEDTLGRRFGSRFEMQVRNTDFEKNSIPVPDFIVNIKGIEFTDTQQSNLRGYDLPRTVHVPEGVLIASRAVEPVTIRPSEVGKLLNACVSNS